MDSLKFDNFSSSFLLLLTLPDSPLVTTSTYYISQKCLNSVNVIMKCIFGTLIWSKYYCITISASVCGSSSMQQGPQGCQIEPKVVICRNSGRFKRTWNWPTGNLIYMRNQGGSCERIYSKAAVITSESPGELKKKSQRPWCISDQLIRTSEGGTWPGIKLPQVILYAAKIKNCSSRGWEPRDTQGWVKNTDQCSRGRVVLGAACFYQSRCPWVQPPGSHTCGHTWIAILETRSKELQKSKS